MGFFTKKKKDEQNENFDYLKSEEKNNIIDKASDNEEAIEIIESKLEDLDNVSIIIEENLKQGCNENLDNKDIRFEQGSLDDRELDTNENIDNIDNENDDKTIKIKSNGDQVVVKKVSPRSKAEKITEKKLFSMPINKNYVNGLLRPRTVKTHKGSCGKILIIAGAAGMPGSACLSAKAALRSGSGLVYVATKPQFFPIVQTVVPEAICINLENILPKLDDFDAIGVGPGMGATLATAMLLENILKDYNRTLVIDADALNSLAKTQAIWPVMHATKAETIITPHLGEAARLLQRNSADFEDRPLVARQLYMKYGAVTVVKGHKTLVYNGDEKFFENTTGNPGMATAGSGDVLTGVITSFAGQGLSSSEAAKAGVFIHGRAGDLATERIGEYGVISSDIIAGIPKAIKEIVGK